MQPATTTIGSLPPQPAFERRNAERRSTCGRVWMTSPDSGVSFPCECLNTSEDGMCLRAPLGYGIRIGQRYALSSHLPGSRPIAEWSVAANPREALLREDMSLGLSIRRWGTVVRARIALRSDGAPHDALEIGLSLDEPRYLEPAAPLTSACMHA